MCPQVNPYAKHADIFVYGEALAGSVEATTDGKALVCYDEYMQLGEWTQHSTQTNPTVI